MARLLTTVREAEERLAAVGRAVVSAFDEEVAEARSARTAAAEGLEKARALGEAAKAVGRSELFDRVREVIDTFEKAGGEAEARLSELFSVEEKLRGRLAEPATAPALPPAPEAGPPELPEKTPPLRDEPPPLPAELKARLDQLGQRIGEIATNAGRWPEALARLAVEEHAALARLLASRLDAAGQPGTRLVNPALETLRGLARGRGWAILGLEPADAADWATLAATARAKRLAGRPAKARS